MFKTKEKTNKLNKKGISLIVLVITIIVIIILAAAVILTLTGNNPIENAKQATYINDLSTFQDELDMYKTNEYAKSQGDFDQTILDAVGEAMYTYIPSMTGKTKYTTELAILDGKLIYKGPEDSIHKDWAAMANILAGTVVVNDTIPPTVTFVTNGGIHATEVSTIVNVNDDSGINSSTLQYVWDTQNITEPINGWLGFTTGNNLTKTGTGIYYLWIKASDTKGNNVVIKSKAFGIGIEELPVTESQTEHKTFSGTTDFAHNNPVIPAGFVAVNTTTASWNNLSTDWNNGLVIQDLNGNQFVWVPVNGLDVKYLKKLPTGTYANVVDDTLPTGITNENNQIDNYKGFYIARFEAGKDSTNLVSKKNFTSWNYIKYNDAKTQAESMYMGSKVKSGLVTGTEWDTLMNWLEISGINVIDSRTWGNNIDSLAPANVSGYGSLKNCGFSNYWKNKNIYDLAGNLGEWCNEKLPVNDPICRGGYYNYSGSSYSANIRARGNINDGYIEVGFRVALYII